MFSFSQKQVREFHTPLTSYYVQIVENAENMQYEYNIIFDLCHRLLQFIKRSRKLIYVRI